MIYAAKLGAHEFLRNRNCRIPLVGTGARPQHVRWTIVLVIDQNDRTVTAALRWMSLQSRSFKLIIIDTPGAHWAAETSREACRNWGIELVDLGAHLPRGKCSALAHAIDHVDTEFVAVCTTDTHYPSAYLRNAEELFDRGGKDIVAVCAYRCPDEGGFLPALVAGLYQVTMARLLPDHAYPGFAGKSFRTKALKYSGGYHRCRSPEPLGDRAMMRRILRHGRQVVALSHWCSPSRQRRGEIRW